MNNQNNNNFIFFLIVAVLVIVLLIFIRRKIKVIKIPSVYLITGAVKTGKSALSVHFAKREYRRTIIKWHISRFLGFIFRKNVGDKPMLYSNIPLKWIRYNRFTIDILMRKVRIPNKSIVLLDEASLIADSMLFKNSDINNRLMLFVKLFGHYTHGGKLIINTQALSDLHFSFKRCINSYCFIYSSTRLPFVTIMKVREMMYSDDKSNITNIYNDDIELSMRTLIIWNRTYKSYDPFCYSIFTDDLPVQVNYDTEVLRRYDCAKATDLITLQDFKKYLGVRVCEKK